MRERMLLPYLGIFLLACCCQFLLAAAESPPAPAFLAFGESFQLDIRDKPILHSQSSNPAFLCGLKEGEGSEGSYYFSVFIHVDQLPSKEVWTANKDKPLDGRSALRLSHGGNLELVDRDGGVVWSPNTSGKPVTAMKLEETGNLVLLDTENRTLWQSFDHPTDTLVARQKLQEGQTLTSSNSTHVSYFVSAKDGDLRAFIRGDAGKPPQMYLHLKDFRKLVGECTNDTLTNGTIYERKGCNETTPQFLITASIYGSITQSRIQSANHFMKLESDGRLIIYDSSADWKDWGHSEFGNVYLDKCLYPLRCGPFGVCTKGNCSCPKAPKGEIEYFKSLDDQPPDKRCKEPGPIPSCTEPNNWWMEHDKWRMEDFGNYSYFGLDSNAAAGDIISPDECSEACRNNCSCRAAFYQNDSTRGDCYLLEEVFSIRTEPLYKQTYTSRAFFKVPNTDPSKEPKSPVSQPPVPAKDALPIAGIAIGSLAVATFVVAMIVFLRLRKREEEEQEEAEDELEQVPGMGPRRFSYEELKAATEDFQTILGRGGFGSVFGGVLDDGTRIAVKRLDNIGQGMKEFLAEVQTIGSIHHMNLVRLVGFCARKSHRLLVYDYMPNGSLDRWIFHENEIPNLDWKTRQNIIMGTSKGLCYLHEDCSHRIAHLDIKPQNILLDENYNAKLSDFGLSKQISRDESRVVTTMRGTPGYLAPEWLSASISEKADVYSFGVVVMEVVCGRRNLDPSQPEGSRHLLKMLYLTQDNQLLDLVDMTDEERSCYGEEAVRVMRIGMWCLQNDHTKRPPMSLVVKALEGTIELDDHIELDPFYSMGSRSASLKQSGSETTTDTQCLLLSGPR